MDLTTDTLLYVIGHWPVGVYGVLLGFLLIVLALLGLNVFQTMKFRETLKESNSASLKLMEMHSDSIIFHRDSINLIGENTKATNKMVMDLAILSSAINNQYPARAKKTTIARRF